MLKTANPIHEPDLEEEGQERVWVGGGGGGKGHPIAQIIVQINTGLSLDEGPEPVSF